MPKRKSKAKDSEVATALIAANIAFDREEVMEYHAKKKTTDYVRDRIFLSNPPAR